MFKNKFIIILGIFSLSFGVHSQLNEYQKALNMITESEQYNSLVKKRKKYHVSDELVIYSKMAGLFQEELLPLTPILEKQIILDSDKENLINDKLLKLNVSNCFKVEIYFSEIKNNIFFAEIIKTRHKLKYKDIPRFGYSYVYMFKVDNSKTELIKTKKVHYN